MTFERVPGSFGSRLRVSAPSVTELPLVPLVLRLSKDEPVQRPRPRAETDYRANTRDLREYYRMRMNFCREWQPSR